MMDRLSLLNEGSNDRIYTLEFLFGYRKALTAFTEDCLVLLLGMLGIIQVPLKLAAVPLRTAIADIWRLKDGRAMLFLEIRTDFVTGFFTTTAVLSETTFAGFAEIPFMSAGLTVQARIE